MADPNPAHAVASQLSGIVVPDQHDVLRGRVLVREERRARHVGRTVGRYALVGRPEPENPASATGLFAGFVRVAASCFAVGNVERGNGASWRSAWNGSTWSIVASPAISTGEHRGTFFGVSSASATLCVAVGQSHESAVSRNRDLALLEQWNGRAGGRS